MFTLKLCPYCIRARRWMEEVLAEHPEYRAIDVEIVDERVNRAMADRYDYYYVPTYYVGGVKVHEGAATRETIEDVFRRAYGG